MVVILRLHNGIAGMQIFQQQIKLIFLSMLLLCVYTKLGAQCAAPINVFPYNEDFEASNGNWARSSAVHWDWGTIVPGSKSVITSAGGGNKCWIVGGLSGANYNSGNSYLQSPCFDFTSLVNPEIVLKVFWETERDFDGVHLQYSLDEGLSWTLLGTENSNSNCQAVNWYNLGSVRFVGFVPGWSGNVQTGGPSNCTNGLGSNQWLTAKHNMGFLGGQSKVVFRFVFGAGTICNNYEGFAVDDIMIRETPPVAADFNFNCVGNNTVDFTNSTLPCQTTVSWNFDDPGSGANNTSNQENPLHTFSGPGTYDVTVTVNFTSGPPAVKTKRVIILGLTPTVTGQNLCSTYQNGSASVAVVGGNGTYDYSWNTTPVQTTPSISNLAGGTYTVTVSANDACTEFTSVIIAGPAPINIAVQAAPATCQQTNGSVNVTVTGGTAPYQFAWSNSAATEDISGLPAGTYSLTVTDNNGCNASVNNILVDAVDVNIRVSLGRDTTICPGQQLVLRPGNFASYRWQDGSTTPAFTVTQTGLYFVEVGNAEGCKAEDSVNITVECTDVYFPASFTPNGDFLNETFGPVGDLSSLKDFNMLVYNRWGQLVFATGNPFIKWDGRFKAVDGGTHTFVWKASYRLRAGKLMHKKGTVTLLR